MGPTGLLIQGNDGNFYGTSFGGGLLGGGATASPLSNGMGTVYRITPSGAETVLHLFTGAPADGASPTAMIQASDGNLYGTTAAGGTNNIGTIFKLTPAGVETILYSFTDGSDGASAQGLIQASDGSFYGTTLVGGSNSGGTVFRLTSAGVLTTLYSFMGGADGETPDGQLLEGSDGNFYGVTYSGGLVIVPGTPDVYGGTVFKVTPAGAETVLHRFSGPDGEWPVSGLIQGSDGDFYGTTLGGSTTHGTIYKITSEGAESTLHTFTSEGAEPQTQLLQASDGNFYGTTAQGGTEGGGTVFQFTPEGELTVLYSFPDAPTSGRPDAEPDTNLAQGTDGALYGTTYQSGAYDLGSFFMVTVSTP
jgi:uncharacterized repeat protein (TIGR03803 family)